MTTSSDETTPVPQDPTPPPRKTLGDAAKVQRTPSGIAVKGLSYPVLQRPPADAVATEPARQTPLAPPADAIESPAPSGAADPSGLADTAAPTDPAEPTPQDEPVIAPTDSRPSSTSPLSDFDSEERSRRWPKALLWTGIAVVVAAGVYVGAQWHFADRIARGTTVAGVEIGGLSSADAVERLESELGAVATAPVPVTAGEAATTIDPAAAGLTFDAEATVAGLTEFTLAPGHLLAQISGGEEITPVTVVDDAKFDSAAEALAADQIGRASCRERVF